MANHKKAVPTGGLVAAATTKKAVPNKGMVTIVINDITLMEYDRSKEPSAEQLNYLATMDKQMDKGIEVAGVFHSRPDPIVRSQLVAQSLIYALADKNNSLAAAMCTWLSDRLPELAQIRAKGNLEAGLKVDMMFNRAA